MNTAEPSPETEDDPLVQECSVCAAAIDISDEEPLTAMTCPACGADLIVSGQVDKYVLQQIVGRGGMGVVYKAYDGGLDRFVALKLLRRDKSDSGIIQQLEKEAAITASITHPHVVRVFTSGLDHGRFFIAMELVDKGTLDDLIHLQGRVAEAQVLEVGIQIAQGLRAALNAGLIHRDVKPGNILFADAHTAKIVDFGLAIFQAEEEAQRGEIWGTPYYVAPEKLDRKPEDFRSDMYSLGGTLFHALAGRPPFEAEDASMVALKHLKSQAVSLQAFAPHVSGRTAYVINRTLSKDPNDRYQSYDEMIEHLDYALEQLKANGGQPQQQRRVVIETEEGQRAIGWVMAAMIGLIVLIGAGVFAFRKQLFNGGDDRGTTAASQAAAAAPFPEARRKIIVGEISDALDVFKENGNDPKLTPMQQEWANFGEGLMQLFLGQPNAAKGPFQNIAKRPSFKPKPEDEKVDAFLRDLAGDLSAPGPILPSKAGSFDPTNHEALGILAYGAKNWALGKLDEGSVLLKQFQEAKPIGRDAWINEFKPTAAKLLEDVDSYRKSSAELKAAQRIEQRTKILADIRKLKGPFSTLAAQLEKGVPTPKPIVLPRLGDWSQTELGAPDFIPTTSMDATGAFTIKAGGADLWGEADSGLFIYRIMEGDCELVARVISLAPADPAAKVGLMIRESVKSDSRNVAVVLLAGGGVSQQLRANSGGATTNTKLDARAPQWLKLVRKGDTITAFNSAEKQDWKQVGTQRLSGLPGSIYLGLAISAHSSSGSATAKVDSLTVTPVRPK
jgi:hypothetical protein